MTRDVFDDYVYGNQKNIGKLPVGDYRFNMAAYNSIGKGPATDLVYFKVIQKPLPTNVTISITKSEILVGENITFNFSATDVTGFTIGIDKDSTRIDTKDCGGNTSYTQSFSEPGNYSAYVTAINDVGYIDSGKATFTVNPDMAGMTEIIAASPIVNSTRAWTIKLSGPVSESSIKDKIYVTNSERTKQTTAYTVITDNGISHIVVYPTQNYTPGDYILWVRDIESVNGTKLKKQVYLKFTVK